MQILTMEYVPGIKINKIQALDQLGVDRKRLLILYLFAWQNHYGSDTIYFGAYLLRMSCNLSQTIIMFVLCSTG